MGIPSCCENILLFDFFLLIVVPVVYSERPSSCSIPFLKALDITSLGGGAGLGYIGSYSMALCTSTYNRLEGAKISFRFYVYIACR